METAGKIRKKHHTELILSLQVSGDVADSSVGERVSKTQLFI